MKDRHIDQWNRGESKIDLRIHDQLIFNKGAEAIGRGKNSLCVLWDKAVPKASPESRNRKINSTS